MGFLDFFLSFFVIFDEFFHLKKFLSVLLTKNCSVFYLQKLLSFFYLQKLLSFYLQKLLDVTKIAQFLTLKNFQALKPYSDCKTTTAHITHPLLHKQQ